MSLVYRHGQRYGLIPRAQESNPTCRGSNTITRVTRTVDRGSVLALMDRFFKFFPKGGVGGPFWIEREGGGRQSLRLAVHSHPLWKLLPAVRPKTLHFVALRFFLLWWE